MQEVLLDAKLVPASPYLRSLYGSHLLIHILVAFQQSHGLRNYVKHNTFQQWVVINLSAVSKVLNSILSSHRSLSRSPSLFIERPKKPPATQAIRHRESTTADVF